MGFFSKLFSRNTLYYPGCLAKSVATDINENYREILKNLGIDFLIIEEFVCCGSPVLNSGFEEDFERLKKKNIELLKKYGIRTIITPCPACARMFKQDYELEKRGFKVKHVSEVIIENVNKIKPLFKKENPIEVTYHDPCHLGRHLRIYDAPRMAMMKAGYRINEFPKRRENAECCGGGGGVKANFPEIANEVAKRRMKKSRTKIIVTSCPLCYLHFKENADKDHDIKEMSHLLKEAVEKDKGGRNNAI